MTASSIVATIVTIAQMIGTIGLLVGGYKLFLKKEMKQGNFIEALSFLICACCNIWEKDYVIMLLDMAMAIWCFRDYVYKKER